MSRIRSIYPGQWTDEDFIVLSSFARLLALSIRNEADDNGVFEWKPLQLKMRLFPADQVDVGALLGELEDHRHVAGYQTRGRRYGVIRNFSRWQRPRRSSAMFPMPEQGQVDDEFLVTQPNAGVEAPQPDERQSSLELEEADVESAGNARETGFPTKADNVRLDEDRYVVPENPGSVSQTESVAAREKVFDSEGNPSGRDAPLPLEHAGAADNVVNIESGQRKTRASPTITARIKDQLKAKVCRFAHARLPGPIAMEAATGVWSEDTEEAQRWLDFLDGQMRRAGWDDMREWKRQSGIA